MKKKRIRELVSEAAKHRQTDRQIHRDMREVEREEGREEEKTARELLLPSATPELSTSVARELLFLALAGRNPLMAPL